jgi:hypothetical protein
MTVADSRETFNELLAGFLETRGELDRAILDHSIDRWPMGKLAKQYRTTAPALHRRKKELMLEFRDHLLKSGIACSTDVFND